MRLLWAHPPHRPFAAGLLQHGSFLQPRPSRLDAARPLRLAAATRPSHAARPARHSRRLPDQAKPGATSDGGGDGARAVTTPTPMAGIARARALML